MADRNDSSVATVAIALIAILVIVALGIFALRAGGLGGSVMPENGSDVNIDATVEDDADFPSSVPSLDGTVEGEVSF